MPEFLTLLPPPDALARLLEHLSAHPVPEEIPTLNAFGRVTFAPITAPHPLPEFPRSTVDGYAVRATDTYGASESLPAYLRLIGEVPMGGSPGFILRPTECALIHTGGMLPDGADAVVMIEHTQAIQRFSESASQRANEPANTQYASCNMQYEEIEILRAAAGGENVIKAGEDVKTGEDVIPVGTILRPAEIGGMMALGITAVRVSRCPRVGILSSGDEVVPPDVPTQPGQVRDVNTYTLRALITQAGGEPIPYGIIPDNAEAFRRAARRALDECDIVIFTAGSSVSVRDLTAQTIDELGKPGVLVHGVNVRPGKPTILAMCDGKPVIGLPGNPVSALVIAQIFVVPIIERLLGLKTVRPRPSVPAQLSLNLSSQAGREDWVPVQLVATPDGYRAEPVFGKSNLIFTLARADGLIRIPADANGLAAGEEVEVMFL
ncbi:MAG TPA: gephyrin-like molybdotransferase Glp [Anaerolineales bacterium]|nr:gephyrin-like molybdotransferase Glp [Anaerolineales bacterium]